MNSSIFKILWIWISIPWLSSFTRAEKVALFAALLVLFGVIGEEVVELKFLEAPERARLKRNIKRWSISLLLLGLSGDVVGINMGQAEMASVTKAAGDAATSAKTAHDEADAVGEKAAALMTELDRAEGKLRQLQIFALARHLSDPEAFTESLKPLKGENVLFRSYVGDAEGWMLCTSLWDAAHKAGMDATNQCGQWPLDAGGALIRGLHVYGPQTETILNALLKGRITGGAEGDFGPGPFLIFAGVKNPFWLPEQALAAPPQQKNKNSTRKARK
jgi:hypothetical protein